mgnify:CR=1 FL=1
MGRREDIELRLKEIRKEEIQIRLGEIDQQEKVVIEQEQQATQSNAAHILDNFSDRNEIPTPQWQNMGGMYGSRASPAIKKIKGLGEGQDKAVLRAAAIGTTVEELDVDTGADFTQRMLTDFLPSEAHKERWYQNRYGKENVKVLSEDGQPQMYFKNPETSAWTKVDEDGFGMGDIADMTREGVQTSAALLALPSGGTSILGGAAIMGATTLATGMALDVAFSKKMLPEEETDYLELGTKNAKEAALGFGLDAIVPGAGKVISKAIIKSTSKNMVQSTLSEGLGAAERLSRNRGIKMGVIPQSGEKVKSVTEALPGGMASKRMSGMQDLAHGVVQLYRGNVKAAKDVVINAAKRFEQSVKDEIDMLKKNLGEDEAAFITEVSNRFKKKFKNAAGKPNINPSVEGKTVTAIMGEQYKKVSGAISERYNKIYDSFENSKYTGVAARGDDVPLIAAFRGAVKGSGILGGAKVIGKTSRQDADAVAKQLLSEIGEKGSTYEDLLRVAGTSGAGISYRKLDTIIRRLEKKSNWDAGAVTTGDAAAASAMAKNLKVVRDKALDKLSTKGKTQKANVEAYRKVRDDWQEQVLPFKKKRLSALIDEEKAGVDVLDHALSSADNIKSALQYAGAGKEQVRERLLRHFLDRKGIHSGTNDYKAIKWTLEDKEMLKALGMPPAKIRNLERLSALSQSNAVSSKNIHEFIETNMPPKEAKDYIDKLSDFSKRERQIEITASKSKFSKKKALESVVQLSDRPERYVGDIMGPATTPKVLDNLLGSMNDLERQSFGQSTMEWLLKKTEEGAQKTSVAHGERDLFNPKKWASILADNETKFTAIYGKEGYQELVDLGTVVSANSATAAKPASVRLTGGISPQSSGGVGKGFVRIMATPVTYAKNKIMSAAYGSGFLSRFVKGEMKGIERGVDGGFSNLYKAMITSAEGLEALMIEADKDPEFAAWIFGDIEKFNRDAGQYQNTIDRANNPTLQRLQGIR